MQTNISTIENKRAAAQTKTTRDWLIIIGLLLSFAALALPYIYRMNFRILIATDIFSSVVVMGLVLWGVFELILRLYFYFVSFSIYTFVVPKREAFYQFRFYCIFRNLLVAAVSCLIFVFPLIYNYLAFFTILINFGFIFVFFQSIRKKYLNPLLTPFAFKAFMRPFLIYEALSLAFTIGGLIL